MFTKKLGTADMPWENGVDQFGENPNVYKLVKQTNRLNQERWVVRLAYVINRDRDYEFTDGPNFPTLEEAQNYCLSRLWATI